MLASEAAVKLMSENHKSVRVMELTGKVKEGDHRGQALLILFSVTSEKG